VLIDSSENILWDSISGLGFAIAFYYGITAIAAPILFRKHVFKSFKNLVLVGLVPLLGFATLTWVFVKSAIDYWNPENSYTPAWFAFGDFEGVGPALVIGIGMLLIGVPLWIWARIVYKPFFSRKAEAAESLTDLLPDEYRVTEGAVEVPGELKEFPAPSLPKTPMRKE